MKHITKLLAPTALFLFLSPVAFAGYCPGGESVPTPCTLDDASNNSFTLVSSMCTLKATRDNSAYTITVCEFCDATAENNIKKGEVKYLHGTGSLTVTHGEFEINCQSSY